MKKKYKVLFVTIITIILIFLVEIHLFANELPLANAEFAELKNFAEGHMNVNDELWKDVSIDLAKSWYSTTSKQQSPNNAAGVMINSVKTFYKNLYQSKLKEAEQLEQAINNGNQTITDMKEAYKTIPYINASAEEIDRFIKSDAAYNNLNNLKSVNKEVAKKWRDTVSAARIDIISREMYTKTVDTLNDFINGEDINSNKEELTNKIEEAIDATQTTVEDYKKQILQIQMDLGIARTDVEFTDVLTDIGSYIPTDEASDGRLESKVSVILTVITNIGMVLAVLMVAIIGVKYMLGSVEEKAEYKKDMIPYLVGACLLFGITVIVKVLQQIGQSINNI